ncbi:MAG: 16S rRNA (adenine(1518)-N(6)/adenine(1519)-N(6))-dimethyltransferase RsmA [Planctomycetota bacterium]|nr:16S rRNA (adenine(1518)-N(6)/adenine(1519)-N(6))-dimethyltransferase RsmA [Planctomycetota bacterium]
MKQQEPPNPRQTLAFLIKLFQKHNLGAKSKLGQNFLIDLNLVDLVARSGDLSPEDAVLEVGTGTGSLTGRMALEAGSVTSVEIDPGFARMARELLGANPKVRLVESDALLNKNTMEPTVLAAWREMAAKTGCTRLKMVANLPYSVAVPVLTNLLIEGPVPVRMVGMVQWEIAERMMATPGHKQFGSLAVLIQALSKVTVIRRIPPRSFFPAPKVDSAIVQLDPDPAMRAEVDKLATEKVGGPRRLRDFLRDLYCHRRKNLRGGLVAMQGRDLTKKVVDERLAAMALPGEIRAEALDVATHLRLCAAFG